MNTYPTSFSKQQLERVLPHRRSALILDRVQVVSQQEALGYFVVRSTDQRMIDHFDSLAGHWQLEFAQLTAAVLLLHNAQDQRKIPLVTNLHESTLFKMVFPDTPLCCHALLKETNRNAFSFVATITEEYSNESVAQFSFSGRLMHQRNLEDQKNAHKRKLAAQRAVRETLGAAADPVENGLSIADRMALASGTPLASSP